jgi:hypothetical protein
MDNLSAGTRFLLRSKEGTYQPIAQRRLALGMTIPTFPTVFPTQTPKTGCLRVGIAVGFASELLSGFVRNYCRLSIGISVGNASEYPIERKPAAAHPLRNFYT